MIELRPYQWSVITALMASRARRRILVAPTGSGKTVIASQIIHEHDDKTVLFLAHRRELIHQTQAHLENFGVEAGIILAGEPTDPDARVQVASIQTLWSRHKRERGWIPQADIVFVDEAHRSRARTYQALIGKYPELIIIGMTATPCRGDGRGLGNVFDDMVECPQVQELIDRNYLVGTRVFAPSIPNLNGVSVRLGDYVESQLAHRMDQPKLVGDIVSHWHRLAERRKSVVFASSVAHSIHLRDEFVKSGVKAEHIDGSTPKDERDDILQRLSRGDLELVSNCMVLVEGWDMPDVACAVLARPTKHMGLYRQMIGRVLRPYPGKEFALVLDHAGSTFEHGFAEEPVIWTLDSDKRAEAPAHVARTLLPSTSRLVACTKCSAVRLAGKPCPVCGYMPRRPGEYLSVIDGELTHLNHRGRIEPNQYSIEAKRDFYLGLLHLAQTRGNKSGAAAHRYKDRFGEWPPRIWGSFEPMRPSPEVTAWDRHCRIRYAKSMQKAQATGG